MMAIDIPDWPYVYGSPSASGVIRSLPEDFFVDEMLSFEPSGAGEHVFLQIEKIGENTEFVARLLARFANVRQRDIGYAGLKDRHAVTRQWFSVWLPGQEAPDWSGLETDNLKILQAVRHARKLKRGVLAGNRFQIIVRDWQGDKDKTEQQLQAIKAQGVANYYGSQRFGHAGQNVNKALAMFAGAKVGREQRSLYLSAARSFLFNHILAKRIAMGVWAQPLAGDCYVFDCSHSCFRSEQADAEILRRLAEQDIHPSAVLWGKGAADVSGEALALEQAVLADYPDLANGLIAAGASRDRRPLRVNAADLSWAFTEPGQLLLSFSLPAGSYATALLREIVNHG